MLAHVLATCLLLASVHGPAMHGSVPVCDASVHDGGRRALLVQDCEYCCGHQLRTCRLFGDGDLPSASIHDQHPRAADHLPPLCLQQGGRRQQSQHERGLFQVRGDQAERFAYVLQRWQRHVWSVSSQARLRPGSPSVRLRSLQVPVNAPRQGASV